jgi:hypothetical protein
MRIRFTKAPTFTKAIIAAAVFTIAYLASTSNLPPCSDTIAVLNSSGECIERQSLLHTGSGWLALICLAAAVLLLVLKYKDSILGRLPLPQQASQMPQQASQATPPQAQPQAPGRAPGFCPKCGTRILAGDSFCQGCGVQRPCKSGSHRRGGPGHSRP